MKIKVCSYQCESQFVLSHSCWLLDKDKALLRKQELPLGTFLSRKSDVKRLPSCDWRPDARRVQGLTLGAVPPESATLLFETGCLSGTWSFWIWLHWLTCKPQRSSCLCQCWGYRPTPPHLAFMWILRPNAGSQVWQALYWRLSSWPRILSLWPGVSHPRAAAPRSAEPLLPPARPLAQIYKAYLFCSTAFMSHALVLQLREASF